ncbi:trypsin-1-like [Uloborus diversus]|uniref:trypsin-1-like n=1 Tax=Uloborus diversus TaxID=327109 RepID=UPI0024090C26|nr:trypsin-1-like [Uloborus diversus]
MRKEIATMRSWCSVILIFGFFSCAKGYFKAPGMESLGGPYEDLLRGGSPHMQDDWDEMTPVMNSPAAWKIPHVQSFYHKPEGNELKLYPAGRVPNEDVFYGELPKLPRFHQGVSPAIGFPKIVPKMRNLPRTMTTAIAFAGEIPDITIFSGKSPNVRQSERVARGEQRVVGGRDVSEGEIPWQISLQRKSMKSGRIFHICGGSIIKKEWVVTAAHCVALALLSNYRVVAATTNLRDENRIKGLHSSDYDIHKVVDVHIHDEYDMFRFRNDIALLKIEPPFEWSHKVQSIDLPSSGYTAHGHAYASGWGLLQEGVRVTPSRLQAVSLPIIPDHECRRAYGDNLAETMICAGYPEGGKSVCQGDSGGPLFQKHGEAVLIGVVSWGVGCARPGKPGVYTEVSHYVHWIRDITDGGFGRQNLVN